MSHKKQIQSTLEPAASAETGAEASKLLKPDDFWLSAVNPIATAAQVDAEAQAISIVKSEPVIRAREQAAMRWRVMAGSHMTAEAESRLDELLDEYCFCYALKAVNGDANYPIVVAGLYGPAHEWFGMAVPGSRGSGGDGPDQNYSFLPVDYGGYFELEGRRLEPGVADTTYTLTGNLGFTMTLGNLDAGGAGHFG